MQPLEWLKLLRWIGLVSNDETTSNITWNIEIIEYLMQQEINNAQIVGYGLRASKKDLLRRHSR